LDVTEFLERLDALATRSDLDFHRFFRFRSLAQKELHKAGMFKREAAVAIPPELIVVDDLQEPLSVRVAELRNSFLTILFADNSARILWHLYCVPVQGSHSALAAVSPSLGKITNTVRGGYNVYKLSGWLVHVLIAYGIVAEYVPQGRLPATCQWPQEVATFFSGQLRTWYEHLDSTSRLLLRVAMLGHDIGVAVDITDHDVHGALLVEQYIRELGLSDAALTRAGLPIALEDFVWAVRSAVRYHTFLSRIGVELSIQRCVQDARQLLESGMGRPWRLRFLTESFSTLLLLITVADLIAIDDDLLDSAKLGVLRRSHDVLRQILRGHPLTEDPVREGYERLARLAGAPVGKAEKSRFDAALVRFGYDPVVVWTKFYHLQELNFALSVLLHLDGENAALLVVLVIVGYIDERLGTSMETYVQTRVVLDPGLCSRDLCDMLSMLASESPVTSRLSLTDDQSWIIGGIEITGQSSPDGHLVRLVKRHG
jgi:hypothetical protein